MTYYEDENDYISDPYYDDLNAKDEVINDLKKLANKHDIKAIRQYIIINKTEQQEIKD